MGEAPGHRKSVSLITPRLLPSASLALRFTPVRGRDGDKMEHTHGVCYHYQDLITGIM
jgi:hypothetical protein